MPRVKLFKEEEVLQRAMELFWKQGFHATSIQDLVSHLGINRASLYDTFGSKEELFERALQLYRTTNKKGIVDFLNQQPSVKAGLLALFEQSIQASIKDPDAKGCFVVNTTTELLPASEDIRELAARNKADFEQIFYDHLQKGVASGEISKDKDLKTIAAMLFTLHNGIKVIAKIKPHQQELLAIVETGLSVLD